MVLVCDIDYLAYFQIKFCWCSSNIYWGYNWVMFINLIGSLRKPISPCYSWVVFEDKTISSVVKMRITSIFAHKMDSIYSLRIIFLNSGTNGSFLSNLTQILDKPSWFCADFEDNHPPVLRNYGKIWFNSAVGNYHNNFMIQNVGRP